MVDWKGYKNYDHYFTVGQEKEFLAEVESVGLPIIFGKKNYYNIPCSFDIEPSSFTTGLDEKGNPIKGATMYIWQMGINGSVIYGRTWEEWFKVLHMVVDYLNLSSKHNHIIIYVHNLGYEFQWIRKFFSWDKVFAAKERRPIYAQSDGIEFRCSYFLSNYALSYIGDNLLMKYPVKKLVGDLDYTLVRHSATPLTSKELSYCLNDVRVVMSYIQEKIENDGDITKIPLTNTGYVRNYCREECFFHGIDKNDEESKKRALMNYRAIMKSLQIQSTEEYYQLQRAFSGGFTHASVLYSGKKLYDVGSADLTSSYPYHMCAKYFPMTKANFVGSVENDKIFNHFLSKYCCLFDIEFTNLQPLVEFENTISYSKCKITGNYIINNGRVVSADKCLTTLTELDFDTIRKFYKWDSIKVTNMRLYHRGYLPKALILSILNMYKGKTSLKGVAGKEIEYLVSKGLINASFGMMVTAILRDNYEYFDEWIKTGANAEEQINSYNKNFNRFLFYAWGVWTTAHARHSLFTAIYEFGADYVYSDTDSIKGINFNNHLEYFSKYNSNVFRELLTMCNYYKIPFSMVKPKTKKGVEKMLGLWEMENGYDTFKTVGAKRYLYIERDKDGNPTELNMTVSGLNKKEAIPYLLKENDNNIDLIFEKFGDGMFIEKGHTGKLTLTYIDEETDYPLVDYLGNEYHFHEMSSVHMEPQSYFMSISSDYLKLLRGIKYVEL